MGKIEQKLSDLFQYMQEFSTIFLKNFFLKKRRLCVILYF